MERIDRYPQSHRFVLRFMLLWVYICQWPGRRLRLGSGGAFFLSLHCRESFATVTGLLCVINSDQGCVDEEPRVIHAANRIDWTLKIQQNCSLGGRTVISPLGAETICLLSALSDHFPGLGDIPFGKQDKKRSHSC